MLRAPLSTIYIKLICAIEATPLFARLFLNSKPRIKLSLISVIALFVVRKEIVEESETKTETWKHYKRCASNLMCAIGQFVSFNLSASFFDWCRLLCFILCFFGRSKNNKCRIMSLMSQRFLLTSMTLRCQQEFSLELELPNFSDFNRSTFSYSLTD